MKSLWAIALWLGFACSLQAGTVLVQAEDKNEFSRLSFVFPTPVKWRLEKTAGGYDVIFPKLDEKIDLSQVLAGAPVSRIKSVDLSANGTKLRIGVPCACTAEAFEYRPGFLTIKIFGSSDPIEQARNDQPIEAPDAMLEKPAGILPEFWTRERETTRNVGTFPFERVPEKDLDTPNENPAPKTRISEIREQVLAQLSKAASQGLIEADLEIPVAAPPPEPKPAPEKRLPPVKAPETHSNLHIETSVDRANSGSSEQQSLTDSGALCIRDKTLDLPSWGDPDAVFQRIAQERVHLIQEFDRVDRQALTRYVQANLYAGFGAEAIAAQSAFGEATFYPEILARIGLIMDGDGAVDEAVFGNQIGCDGRSALWSALSANDLGNARFINRKAIIRSFAELPAHIRRHLGPSLANKFIEIGDLETAQTLRHAIERALGQPTQEMKLLDAQIDHAGGQNQGANTRLEEVVAQDGEFAITALITLLKAKLNADEQINPDMVLTAQSMAFEQRGSKQSATLQALIALAQGRNGEFPQAIASLKTLESSADFTDEERVKTWSSLLESAANTPDDAKFTEFIYATLDELNSMPLAKKARLQAAKRLIKEGFSRIAVQVLNPDGEPNAEEAALLAKAALLEGRAGDALVYAEALPTALATSIRARAYLQMGAEEKAKQEYAKMPDAKNSEVALWQIGAWEQLEKAGNGAEYDAARVMLNQPLAENTEASGLYETSQAKLGESEAVSRMVAELLKKYEPLPPLNF